MVNVSAIPIYYVSFNPSETLENHFADRGFTNVNHFPAVDGRVMDPEDLYNDGTITLRAYTDLRNGRSQVIGIPALGAIGCSLSHIGIWQLCVDNNLPYVIVAEEDCNLRNLSDETKTEISRRLEEHDDAVVMGTPINNPAMNIYHGDSRFVGAHFYVLSRTAAEKLLKNSVPIDIQVDTYIDYMGMLGKIHLSGMNLAYQSSHGSSTQKLCPTCILPRSTWPYILILFLFVGFIVMAILFYIKLNRCRKGDCR